MGHHSVCKVCEVSASNDLSEDEVLLLTRNDVIPTTGDCQAAVDGSGRWVGGAMGRLPDRPAAAVLMRVVMRMYVAACSIESVFMAGDPSGPGD
jgi:hypothetical protein